MDAMNDTEAKELCEVYRDRYPDLTNTVAARVAFAVVYGATFLLGVAGNGSVIYVTLRHRNLQSVQNVFIVNLSVAGVLVCLLSIPVTPVFFVYKEWFFGRAMCHLFPLIQGSSILIATFTLAAIALHRYAVIVHPTAPPLTKRGSLVAIGVIWTASLLIVSPYAYHMGLTHINGTCGDFCDEKWPSTELRQAFSTSIFAVQFVVPFIVMAYCYARVFAAMRAHVSRKLSRSAGRADDAEKANVVRRRQRSVLILVSMVIIFAVAWLPHNVVMVLNDYTTALQGHREGYFIYLINHAFTMLTVLSNPLLYAWLNASFRSVIRKTLRIKGGRPLLQQLDGRSSIAEVARRTDVGDVGTPRFAQRNCCREAVPETHSS